MVILGELIPGVIMDPLLRQAILSEVAKMVRENGGPGSLVETVRGLSGASYQWLHDWPVMQSCPRRAGFLDEAWYLEGASSGAPQPWEDAQLRGRVAHDGRGVRWDREEGVGHAGLEAACKGAGSLQIIFTS